MTEANFVVSVDTIPWGLLKEIINELFIDEIKFQWILFLGAYLKTIFDDLSTSPLRFSGYYSLGLT